MIYIELAIVVALIFVNGLLALAELAVVSCRSRLCLQAGDRFRSHKDAEVNPG